MILLHDFGNNNNDENIIDNDSNNDDNSKNNNDNYSKNLIKIMMIIIMTLAMIIMITYMCLVLFLDFCVDAAFSRRLVQLPFGHLHNNKDYDFNWVIVYFF